VGLVLGFVRPVLGFVGSVLGFVGPWSGLPWLNLLGFDWKWTGMQAIYLCFVGSIEGSLC